MPLRRGQPISIQFSGGIETKQDSKQVPATRLLDLQNATFVKQTTLAKRNGYESLRLATEGTGVTITSPVGVSRRDDELILFDGKKAYGRREAVNAWSDAGEVACPTMVDRPLARTGTQQSMASHASANGLVVAAWEDGRGGVWFSASDETGRVIIADTQLDASGQQPICAPCGTVVHVMWAVPGGRLVKIVVIDSLLPLSSSLLPLTLVSDLSPTNPSFDACFATSSSPNFTGSGSVIAWASDAGFLRIGYIHPSGAIGSALNGMPAAGSFPAQPAFGVVSVAYDRANDAWVCAAYATSGNTLRAVSVTAANLGAGATGSQDWCAFQNGTWNHVSCEMVGTPAVLWCAADLTPTGQGIDRSRIHSGAFDPAGNAVLVSGTTRILKGHQLASRALADGSDVHIAVVHPVKFFPYVAVVRLSGSIFGSRTPTSARALPGRSTGARARAALASVIATDGNAKGIGRSHAFATGERIQLASANGDQFGEAGIRIVTLRYDDPDAYQCAQLGHGLYMAGALLQHYDGSRWAESGFHCAPDTAAGGPFDSSVIVGAGGLSAGTYVYAACYEEVDAQGEIHRGPVSTLATFVSTGSRSVQLNVQALRLTGKRNVRIGIFRSIANDPSELFRVTSTDPTATAGSNAFVPNDPTVDSISFTDTMTDAVLLTKEPLYTNGGVLSNDPTSCAGGAILTAKNRLFWLDPGDPNKIRFSQPLNTADESALEESASLSVLVDPFGGRIVALSSLDDAIVVHKETATHVFVGPGPDPDGGTTSGAGFSPPALLTSDVGCSSPRSVVQMPLGVMLHTSKGIVLLGRDRQVVTQVGDPVYGFKDQRVARATLLPDRHQILFLTSDNGGRTLLYDYEHQQWSTYTNHVGADAVVVGGAYVYLRSDGRVFRETPGIYQDDNQHIPMLISTAWIKMTGILQAFQKVLWAQILGAYRSSHTLRMRYRLDYQDAWSVPVDVNVDADYNPSSYGVGSYGVGSYGGSGTLDAVYEQAFHINRRCQSIAFEFSDREADGVFGAAFELSELLLTGGVLGGRYPVGDARMQ